jgi:hypothetical protein
MRILLVEDDERLAELTGEYLEIQGYEVCWEVRQHYSGVILMLTARDEDLDQIPGLERGRREAVKLIESLWGNFTVIQEASRRILLLLLVSPAVRPRSIEHRRRFLQNSYNDRHAARCPLSRQRPNIKNRVAPEIEQAVVELAVEQPAWGQMRIANELLKRGLMISAAGVRCVWQRNDLENMNKRLKARGARAIR